VNQPSSEQPPLNLDLLPPDIHDFLARWIARVEVRLAREAAQGQHAERQPAPAPLPAPEPRQRAS
jgi:hypothetical protein